MIKNERQQQILDFLNQTTYASVDQLAEITYSSPPTIRRDLSYLAEQGYVIRNHGGVMLPQAPSAFIPTDFRRSFNSKHKKALCKAASKLLKEHMLIFLNESTTTQFLIEYMKDIKGITVITNSLLTANLLNQYNVNFYCTGGRITHSNCFTGNLTERFIRLFNADLFFFSSHAISSDGVISDNSEPEYYAVTAMLEQSKKCVYLCDESKVNKKATYIVTDARKLYKVYTTALPECFNGIPDEKMVYVNVDKKNDN